MWRDVELQYSPKDLHKPYIISEQKHIYYKKNSRFTAWMFRATILHQTNDILVRKSIEITWNL